MQPAYSLQRFQSYLLAHIVLDYHWFMSKGSLLQIDIQAVSSAKNTALASEV